MSIPPLVIKPAIFCVLVLTSLPGWANSELQLTNVVNTAIENDPWLRQSARMQDALIEESYAEGALPDPRVTIGAANLPTDTFDTGQEAMTQATIGFSQRIPRGDSLQLAGEQKTRMAEVQPFRRENRREQVTERVTHLWLELWRTQESIRLIESNRGLFEQLSDVAEAGYTSATMGSRQQDIIRASLELTRLEDRLAALNTQLAFSRESLGEWIGADAAQLPVPGEIPPELLAEHAKMWPETDVNGLIRHPSIRATDQLIDAQAIDVDLARQAYKPEWSVFAQYGYRDRAPNGQDRADLFSVGIGFDLPIFTGNRQDRKLRSSTARLEAARSERILQMRELQARARAAMARIEQLDDRIRLYRQTLIPQMEQQASAALTAYDNDDGDFAEAVRARIDELNARVELIQIVAERAKNLASFRYLTAHSSETPSSSLPNDQD
ncbi:MULTISPECIES: TolC family protein [Marinobacter]|uniref:Transporter n=1 Tax=Marinobacter profundi TaxID=2666256 RepID=A0A2G1UMU2_9GAMM|nr:MULTISPECIES: TolC family protein [Marinobacter]MBD3657172.1 TolC family protein [Marinobacter sp.]PHQ15821.1 transporter [Marinobacter profundi]